MLRVVLGALMLVLTGGLSQQVGALPISGGVVSDGEGCTTFGCSTIVYELQSAAAGSGDLDLNTGAGTLSFNFTVPSSIFLASGGPDNGVTSIEFVSLVYTGSVTVTETSTDIWTIDASQTGEISGSFVPTGAGVGGPVSVAASLLSGSCNAGGSLFCGINFGALADFDLSVAGETRWFNHSLNLQVPEPGAALLLLTSILGLVLAGRFPAAARAR